MKLQDITNGHEYIEVEDMTAVGFVFLKRCREVYDGKLSVCRKSSEVSRMP